MASHNPDQPNIVFILSDDQGPWAMGCAGNTEIRTPNLDRLAASGIRFENFFCTSPVCSPARASLLTGRIPSQHGIHDWIREGNTGQNAVEYLAGQLAYTEILADNGYTCGMSGKWHLGDSYRPQKSFSHWYVHERGGGPYYDVPMIRQGELEAWFALHVDPHRDGTHEAVTGKGQLNLAGPAGKGIKAFADLNER